jgi:hypothetical protein
MERRGLERFTVIEEESEDCIKMGIPQEGEGGGNSSLNFMTCNRKL